MQTWKHQPTEEILTKLAEITMGFSGSDIQALCTESVLCCLKRLYPKVQNPSEIRKVKLDMEEFKVCAYSTQLLEFSKSIQVLILCKMESTACSIGEKAAGVASL